MKQTGTNNITLPPSRANTRGSQAKNAATKRPHQRRQTERQLAGNAAHHVRDRYTHCTGILQRRRTGIVEGKQVSDSARALPPHMQCSHGICGQAARMHASKAAAGSGGTVCPTLQNHMSPLCRTGQRLACAQAGYAQRGATQRQSTHRWAALQTTGANAASAGTARHFHMRLLLLACPLCLAWWWVLAYARGPRIGGRHRSTRSACSLSACNFTRAQLNHLPYELCASC